MTRTSSERLADIPRRGGAGQPGGGGAGAGRGRGTEDEAQLAFNALLYRLVVIGEAVKALPADLLARQSQVPWRDIARLRDLLAHHYYRVDAQIIRRTVDTPLSEMRDAVARLLSGEQD